MSKVLRSSEAFHQAYRLTGMIKITQQEDCEKKKYIKEEVNGSSLIDRSFALIKIVN